MTCAWQGQSSLKFGQARIVIGKITSKGNIVQKRIEPDEGDIVRVERKFDAPGKPLLWPGDAKITGKALDRVEQFGPAPMRDYEIGVGFNEVFEPIFVFYEREIPVLFLQKNDLTPFGPKLSRLISFLVSQKLFLSNAVIPGVFRLR